MQNSHVSASAGYRERLTPGLGLLVVIALLGPLVALIFLPVDSTFALVLGIIVSVALVVTAVLLSPVVSVKDGMLRAGRAHIDVSLLGDPLTFDGEDARLARGQNLPHDGWHLIRGGLTGVVRVPLTDPHDPHPSWTISTRTPDRLAAAIRRAKIAGQTESELG